MRTNPGSARYPWRSLSLRIGSLRSSLKVFSSRKPCCLAQAISARLSAEAMSSNSIDVAQRASSAAAGALILYQRARAEQRAVMEKPTGK